MLDAHLADVVEVADAVRAGEIAAGFGLLGGLDVLIGDEVVEDDGDAVAIEDLGEAGFVEFVDGDGGGDVIAEDDVQLCADQLSCGDLLEARVCRHDLLRHGHAHG